MAIDLDDIKKTARESFEVLNQRLTDIPIGDSRGKRENRSLIKQAIELKTELTTSRPKSRDDTATTTATNNPLQKTGDIMQTLTNAVKNPLVIGGVVLIGGAIVMSKRKRK